MITRAGADTGIPLTFASHAEAERELEEYLADTVEAVEAGDMAEAYDRDGFRIVEVRG